MRGAPRGPAPFPRTVMSDDWNSDWYKRTGRRLPLWVVYAAAGLALIVLLVVLVRLA
jgi:hypothetical protein